ncbi:uncharacterized protein LOC117329800 [Pecten maximus]|uniref:uncharacterized protein LOC117329800 n=1 Tax=Pecten maximus TaxID=6579 RepID=UPI0014587EAC|nr:uncharacterized protein LOC117329800 [Pecten maximus]
MWSPNSKQKKILLFVCMLCVLFYLNHKYNTPMTLDLRHADVHAQCVIPEIDPFDKELTKLDKHPKPPTCSESMSLVFIDMNGYIQFNTSSFALNKLSKSEVVCSYRPVERSGGDDDVILKPEVQFTEPEYIESDVVVASCLNKKAKLIYQSVLTNIDFRTVLRANKIKMASPNQFNVILFGIDSLSRTGALRKIPKTMKYIQNDLGGITFKGYTKVGGNTFPNVVPLLTGRRADKEDLGHAWGQEYYDEFPLIQYNYSSAGYVTNFAEDWPYFSTFNYLSNGFKVQPTDHYLRPMYLTMKKLAPVSTSLEQVSLYLEDKSIKVMPSSLCYQNRIKHVIFLENLKRFLKGYKSQLKFSFSWMSELSHDYPYYLEIADQDFTDFLRWMKIEGHLDNTILLFMSDHGSRIDDLRNTPAGRIEARMPLLSIVLPEHFKKEHKHLVQTMMENTNVLTTAFDVNAMLGDVLHKNFDQNRKTTKPRRGISLFEKIPKERTCANASIAEHFCPCFVSKSTNIDSPDVQKIVNFSLERINRMLDKHRTVCVVLALSQVRDAQLIVSSFKRYETKKTFTIREFFNTPVKDQNKYTILFETAPSGALFEVTAHIESDGEVYFVGDITRTNRYGTQSQCIADKYLRNYCFCKK